MNPSGARRQDGETDCQWQGDLYLESEFNPLRTTVTSFKDPVRTAQ